MAGFWHLSHHQMRDPNGAVYAGARALFFEADTLNPITVYADYGLGTPHPNPVVANAFGIFPPVFLDEADGFYRQRITSSGGVIIPGTDVGTLPIIGPGEGGGGAEVPVDPNALLQTGDPLWVPKTGTRSGFVRMNGRTIGSATSGAAERANADTEALFLYYWATYSNTLAPVGGGRGASAAADWEANKTITLLNMQNKGPFGLDDMGATAAGGFAGITFLTGDATTAGSTAGAATVALAEGNLPPHVHAAGALAVSPSSLVTSANQAGTGEGSTINRLISVNNAAVSVIGQTASVGSGTAVNKLSPAMLGTWYQRL